MSTPSLTRAPASRRGAATTLGRGASPATAQLRFLAGGALLAFALPFVFTDLVTIDRDLYYGIYAGSLPILVVFAALGARRTKRTLVGIGALALAASLAFTAVYHLGYRDFRGSKLRKPLAGDVMWSAPTLLTLNPVGAPLAHAALHVTAVAHSYGTDTFLPPHRVGR